MSKYSAAKQKVLDACLLLADRGFLPGTGGNVALRIGAHAFAVTPSAADYYTMTAEDICVLSLPKLQRLEGDRKPSVEAGLHARLLCSRDDFAASVHTHQPIASAVALINQSIPVVASEDLEALGVAIPIVPYAPSGTWLLARAFGKRLRRDAAAYLLRNHGLVCGGKSIEAAIENVARVERIAASYLRERILNRHATGIDPALRDEVLASIAEGTPES